MIVSIVVFDSMYLGWSEHVHVKNQPRKTMEELVADISIVKVINLDCSYACYCACVCVYRYVYMSFPFRHCVYCSLLSFNCSLIYAAGTTT